MPYKKYPSQNRKYSYSNAEHEREPETEPESAVDTSTVTINEIKEIPLPNETEKNIDRGYAEKNGRRPSFFDGILNRINIEEIILLGLIFLMLEEGVEDEFLLIILIFILFTGI